jgi:RNA recognition motif-containing protein
VCAVFTGGSDPEPTKTLFVHNIPFSIANEEDAEEYLRQHFDNAIEARLIREFDGRLKGFGFVEFSTTEDSQAAMNQPDVYIDGRKIRISFQNKKNTEEKEKKQRY